MAVISHQTQGSCPTFSLIPKPWAKGLKLRSSVAFPLAGGADKFTPLKHDFHLRVQPIVLPKGKPFRVTSFKGNGLNDELGGRNSGSQFSKSPVRFFCTHQEGDATIPEFPDVRTPLSYASEDREDIIAGRPGIENLLRKWLIMLRKQTSNQTIDALYRERPDQNETSQSQHGTLRMKTGKMLKDALVHFLRLNAGIKLPLLMFIPLYPTIKIVYGAEVAKELTPLWFFGPLILALYIKIVQGLCSLYIFCFMQPIRLIKNLTTYYQLVYPYIAEGKLKAYLWANFWKPTIDLKSLDYKDLFRRKLKQLGEWAVDKYLDFFELLWPYLCRPFMHLKAVNLI